MDCAEIAVGGCIDLPITPRGSSCRLSLHFLMDGTIC